MNKKGFVAATPVDFVAYIAFIVIIIVFFVVFKLGGDEIEIKIEAEMEKTSDDVILLNILREKINVEGYGSVCLVK